MSHESTGMGGRASEGRVGVNLSAGRQAGRAGRPAGKPAGRKVGGR